MTIFVLTKTYPPTHKGGGPNIKEAQVNYLKNNLNKNIKVITLTDSKEDTENTEIIEFYYGKNRRYEILKQRLGIHEDYLDSWSQKIINYLKESITKKIQLFP